MKKHFRFKTTILFLSFTILFLSANAQSTERKGFIGVGLGPSFLMGSSRGNTSAGIGLNLNLINFGYTIGKRLGVTATWVGGAHIFENKSVNAPLNGEISYGMLMLGPMYSISLSDVSTLDFKARMGTFFMREDLRGLFSNDPVLNGSSTSQIMRLGYSLAVSYRYQFASRWCLIVSGDYFSAPTDGLFIFDNVKPISLTGGIGFLF